jgi:hypothetical protein
MSDEFRSVSFPSTSRLLVRYSITWVAMSLSNKCAFCFSVSAAQSDIAPP